MFVYIYEYIYIYICIILLYISVVPILDIMHWLDALTLVGMQAFLMEAFCSCVVVFDDDLCSLLRMPV